jgi:hypothetical protein
LRKPDVKMKDEGSVVLFTPVSNDTRAWFKQNVVSEPGQWLGSSLAADPRPACDLLDGIRRRGLRIQVVAS